MLDVTTPPRLDEQICFALYRASRSMTAAYRPMLEEMRLTYPQYLVMMVLWEEDGMRVGAVGDRLGMDMGTLSPLLKRMEARGVVTRERSTADERVVSIHLTAAGKDLGKRASKAREQAFCKADVSEHEMNALRLSLQALIRALEA